MAFVTMRNLLQVGWGVGDHDKCVSGNIKVLSVRIPQ